MCGGGTGHGVVVERPRRRSHRGGTLCCHHRPAWGPVSPDHRSPGDHPAQAPSTDRRRGRGSPPATSAASSRSMKTRTVRPKIARVVPASPVEGGTRVRWRRWFRDPRALVVTSVPARGRESAGFIHHSVKKDGSPHRARDRVRGSGGRTRKALERATSPSVRGPGQRG
jgi:hypothetical protein